MEWVAIADMIFKMIQQCQENRSREAIVAGMISPGPREVLALRRILKGEGHRRKELKKLVAEGIQYLVSMSAVEVEEMVAEALEE